MSTESVLVGGHRVAKAGRRPGPGSSRDAILASAAKLFAERGLRSTTMRAIATDAGVNAATIHHFFGTKDDLFLAALAMPVNPAELIGSVLAAGPRGEMGERLVRVFVRTWRDPQTGRPLQAMLRSAVSTDQGSALIRRLIEEVMLPRATVLLGVPAERVAAGIAQLLGFALLSTIFSARPLAGASEDEIVALLGPQIQRYLDG